ncbi:uncharacterized domain 1-containing protein [Rhodoblastus acidophilus]|uniref:Uncharacterized domain 1-containing protein n=1 Tax=Rhodoblastus acidophilus TaxID=1074 RepID=A0A212S8E6_RHOAC|nr:PaaI family thioesterase [Rhodoblastus acidophilus]PPQ36820.1 PaaI family thioesterase [Rhodoblastus acidophilus]RAI21405.1 aromatic compound degradation protein PaaI [Rhodoblastus acidophilus]SNB81638.1 uncharacterized domain 1-containing protein [Rhodoblastus acidophilus]
MDMKNQLFGLVPQEVAVGMSGLEFLRGILEGRYPAPPFAEVADVWPVSVEKGRLVFEARPSSRFYNPMGLVHGGWLALLLDTAMGCAVHSALEAGKAYATTDLRTTYVKPVREATGRLRCEATLLHISGRTASAEGKILDARGALIAHGSETCQIFPIAKGGKEN